MPVAAAPLLPPPVDLGLPSKFQVWRPGQDRSVVRALDSDKRVVVLALPTGAGKSATYMSIARLRGGRTCVLTSTKALQAQLSGDFAEMGLVEVMGQNTYPCRALTEPHANHLEDAVAGLRVRPRHERDNPQFAPRNGCDEGPCHLGLRCKLRQDGCHYYDAVRTADAAELVVTNYAFWLTINQYRKRRVGPYDDPDQANDDGVIEGIGKFDTLVLDEAHDAPEALSSFLTVKLTQADVEGVLGSRMLSIESTIAQWQQWASQQHGRSESLLAVAIEAVKRSGGGDRTAARQVKALKQLVRTLAMLKVPGVEWVVEPVREDGNDAANPDLQFAPVWPAPLAEQYLFRGIDKILLVSATVRPKTLDYLGIDRADAEFWEEPSTFPIARRPVIHIPTAKLTHKLNDMMLRAWVTRHDQILRARPGVKGIIHTGSYERMRYLSTNMAMRDRLLWHRSNASWQTRGRTLAEALDEFRTRSAGQGLWLISPAVTTGYDFPHDQCRVQIISKVPFPDTRSEIVKARTERDPDYGMYLAMQTLVQATGRSTRSESDWSEVFILDDQCQWFLWKFREFAPEWFLEAYDKVSVIPPAPRWAA
jgi:Rad3-related DNA helicase